MGAASLPVHRFNVFARCCAEGTEEEIPHDEAADEELDEEAKAMLKELDDSQAEVQSLLAAHRVQADELGGMRDNLTNEVRGTWDRTSMPTLCKTETCVSVLGGHMSPEGSSECHCMFRCSVDAC